MKIQTLITFLLLSVLITYAYGQNKQVCFTFDDLPVVSYGINDSSFQKNLFNKLISSLNKNKIQAIGFVNEKKLYINDSINHFQVRLLENWAANGLELGNHTYSHPDYNNVTFKEFSDNIRKGELLTKGILKNRNMSMQYFRHPFLHVGNTKAKADSLTEFLKKNNYEIAPVTIDNEDYLFAVAYKRAFVKKDTILMAQIGQDYIKYMEQKLLYFEQQAKKLFNRKINQILLLHSSLINADYVNALASMFRRNNYEFVNLKKVLMDDAYNTEITLYGNWGISWIDRWALSRGKKGEFFRDDPSTPDYIVELSK